MGIDPPDTGHPGLASIEPAVGRALLGAIDDTVAGRGRVVLLQYDEEGSANPIVEAAALYARRRGAAVSRARCELEAAPLGPWTRLVRACGCVPDAADALVARTRFGRIDALLAILEAAVREAPLLFVVEDLHHADRSSLLMLEAVAHALPAWRLGLMATYCATEVARPEYPLAETLGELEAAEGCLRLGLMGPPARVARPDHGLIRREGDYWTIAFANRLVRLRDKRGLRYLAPLLYRPGEGIHVIELQAVAAETGRQRRLLLADRSRPAAARARVAVAKALKAALERIAEAHPELGEHLAASVRRGYVCSYAPDPGHPVVWRA
jgi:hypothetical protein